MTTIGQVAEWIIQNRRGNAFKGYSLEKIVQQLDECCTNLTMLCTMDGEQITGVVCCTKDVNIKEMHVNDILCNNKESLKRMIKYFNDNFPQYIITGKHRTGRSILITDTNKLQRLL